MSGKCIFYIPGPSPSCTEIPHALDPRRMGDARNVVLQPGRVSQSKDTVQICVIEWLP